MDIARWVSRLQNYPKYLYYHLIDRVAPAYSLERPKVLPRQGHVVALTDQTNSIEFYLEGSENTESDLNQPNPELQNKVTLVPNKPKFESCFICQSPLMPFVQVINQMDPEDIFETSWCSNCDHCQHSVMPSKAWITEWYNQQYSVKPLETQLQSRRPTKRYFNRIKPLIGDRKIKILEIGAGFGEKISAFVDDGHEVHCTETSYQRATYLRNNITKNVYVGTFNDLKVQEELKKNGPFDLIFSYHVVEHIYNPFEELQLLSSLTHDDSLFYLAIPEFYKEGILNNILNLEHMASFSRNSGKMLLNQIGFEVVEASNDLFQYYSDYAQYFIGRRASKQVLEDQRRKFWAHSKSEFTSYVSSALSLRKISELQTNHFAWEYNGHQPLNYKVSEESKKKCLDIISHLPIRLYHNGIPLFWMQ